MAAIATTRNSRRSMPLFWQIMIPVAVIQIVVLGLTLALTLQDSLKSFQAAVDDQLTATVTTLSESPSVRRSAANGVCDPALMDYLDSMAKHATSLDYIIIASGDTRIVYHVEHSRIGTVYGGVEPARALAGESFLADSISTAGEVHRAYGPITDNNGKVIGFLMVGTTHELLDQLRRDVYVHYLQVLALLMICTVTLTGALVLFLKRHLRGTRTEDLLRSFLTQNDILNALDEGLLAVDGKGRIRLVNRAATQALGLREDLLLDRDVDEVIRDARQQSLRGVTGTGLRTSRPNILLSSIALPESSTRASQVLILVDKSEAFRQAEQLGGTRHIINALRANNHESLNKLQVISGLLQMGHIKEVQEFIGSISAAHSRGIGMVMQHIDNPNVAALILGKLDNMRELGIDMTLLGNSHLPEHSQYLSTAELVTVVGNLLENAMEAVDARSGERRSIVLQITEDDRSLVIMVSDSGVGIRSEDLPRIYTHGFSTKAHEGRGIGMALIKEITDHRDGSIEVDTDPDSGTNFTLIFDKKRGDRV